MAVLVAIYGDVCLAPGSFVVELLELGGFLGRSGLDWVFDVEGLSGW